MANKKHLVFGTLIMGMAFAAVLAGCASTGSTKAEAPAAGAEAPVALGLTLEESLGRYAGPQVQNWDDQEVNVYFFDPLRLDELKAELDAGGEYAQDGSNEYNRDWEQGKTFARLAVRPDGRVQLDLCKDDNSVVEYRYKKVNPKKGSLAALEPQSKESIGKYMVPQEQTWGEEKVTVYFLDPLYFEEFKVELDAGDTYYQADSWTENRDWEQGKTFARWAVRADGIFELDLCKADNSRTGYLYKKVHQAGDTWEETWDEGRIMFTYLGLTDPGFVIDPDSDKDGGRPQYKGYYKMTYLDDGGRTVYIYYPNTGRDAQYSKPLD
jgi:hypothetical protein